MQQPLHAVSIFELTVASRNFKNRVCMHIGVSPPLECGKPAQLQQQRIPHCTPPGFIQYCLFRDYVGISFRFQNAPERSVTLLVNTFSISNTRQNGSVWETHRCEHQDSPSLKSQNVCIYMYTATVTTVIILLFSTHNYVDECSVIDSTDYRCSYLWFNRHALLCFLCCILP